MKEADVIPLNTNKDESKPVRFVGTIIKLSERGFGFIVTPSIKFRRIYFYWSSLDPFGIKFEELRKGAQVEFEASEYIDKESNENLGYRAYHIKVLKNGR